ncbi:MAG: hypothetical protein KGL99_12690 [Burkholderiales bacterium]|nr:hypothetical protein [Burkholderiales bacterium]MDE2298304.1 hypothetical protein [Burkholderiales bacterium]MDE2628002.1 hypothetical protein [Burkholderiales bacterium]
MRYRIALCGFGEFEHRALRFSIEHAAALGGPAYEVVEALAQADFAVVDADSPPAVKGVALAGRVAHAVFVGAVAPPGADLHLPRPIDPTRIRRLLDRLSAQHGAPRARSRAPDERTLPTLDDVVASPTSAASAADTALPASASSITAQRAAKEAARSAARRARLASHRAGQAPAEPLHDVLVLDADADASAALCALLERFGFNAYSVSSIAQAIERLEARPFAAYFLDIALGGIDPGANPGADAGAALALLQRIHERPLPEGHPAPAVLMTTAQLHPADRVRATLAGLATPLVKPLSRGDVARALEGSGVALPTDARRR